jgi:hypothetical protein
MKKTLIIILIIIVAYLFFYIGGIAPGYYCGSANGQDGVIKICHWGLPRIY